MLSYIHTVPQVDNALHIGVKQPLERLLARVRTTMQQLTDCEKVKCLFMNRIQDMSDFLKSSSRLLAVRRTNPKLIVKFKDSKDLYMTALRDCTKQLRRLLRTRTSSLELVSAQFLKVQRSV